MKFQSFKGRTLEAGDRVFVYRNLHNRTFSVRNIETGLVVGHVTSLALKDAAFKVSQSGRKRVLQEKRKNVHAGIEGTYSPAHLFSLEVTTNLVTYNPYYSGHFYDTETKEPLFQAKEVYFAASGRVYYN